MNSAPRALYPLLISVFLISCSTQRIATPPGNIAQQQQVLQALTNWEVSGKVALRTSTRSDSASLQWRQQGNKSHLRLSGPAGWGHYQLIADQDAKQVELGEGLEELASAERLQILQQLDKLPVFDLPWWLRGLPAPSRATELQRDAAGLPRRIQQTPWFIYYESFQQAGGLTVPRSLRFVGPEISGKLLLKSWRISKGSESLIFLKINDSDPFDS